MAYDEALAERVQRVLADAPLVSEQKMFGGLTFMVGGNMCCGVVGQDLMLRVGPQAYEEALAEPHTRPMDFTGRPMVGMIYVSGDGCSTEASLRSWLDRALDFTISLPPKEPSAVRSRSRRRPA